MSSSSTQRKWSLFIVLALVAVLMSQIIHELTHAIAMLLVGTGIARVQLFGVLGNPVPDTNAQMVISGSAAIVNIVLGLIAVAAFHGLAQANRPYARLLIMYLAAYNLMTGFGYFFVDALFYAPDAPFFPDWQYVIHILGGGWDVRLPLLIIGTVGLLGVFFWLPNAALRFVADPTQKPVRAAEMLGLTLVPYVAVNVILTILGLSHPLGIQGVVTVIFQYWFGYIALFWAYFIGGLWTDVKQMPSDASAIPSPALPVWIIGIAAMWGVIAFMMLVGIPPQ